MRKMCLILALIVLTLLLAGCGTQTAVETTIEMAEETQTVQVGTNVYEAVCLGATDLSKVSTEYVSRMFWQVENAYEDFAGYPSQEKNLAYSDYPVEVEQGQVFVVDSTMTDGSVVREYYRSSGTSVEGMLVTEQFSVEPVVLIGEMEYKASYLGQVNLEGLSTEYLSYEFWRVEDAYENTKGLPAGETMLAYKDYPVLVEQGQVFAVDYTLTDGSVVRKYYHSNGRTRDGMLVTEEFLVLDGDTIVVGDKVYAATYCGKKDVSADFPKFQYWEFWRAEDAYEDCKDYRTSNGNMPVQDFPVETEQGQVYVIDFVCTNGETIRQYSRTDGRVARGMERADMFYPGNPLKMDTIEISGKEYTARYYGRKDFPFPDMLYMDFWWVEDAYEDCKDYPKVKNDLPFPDFIMDVARGEVYVIDFTTPDGTVERKLYRTDGNFWRNMEVADEFVLEEANP